MKIRQTSHKSDCQMDITARARNTNQLICDSCDLEAPDPLTWHFVDWNHWHPDINSLRFVCRIIEIATETKESNDC